MNFILFYFISLVVSPGKLLDRITFNLLIFCWKELKSDWKFSKSKRFNFRNLSFPPISLSWFKKASFLIRGGKFEYSKYSNALGSVNYSFVSFTSKKVSSKFLKALLLQRAFVILLEPFFYERDYHKDFQLACKVRLVF